LQRALHAGEPGAGVGKTLENHTPSARPIQKGKR
jgi:hypothetical protein